MSTVLENQVFSLQTEYNSLLDAGSNLDSPQIHALDSRISELETEIIASDLKEDPLWKMMLEAPLVGVEVARAYLDFRDAASILSDSEIGQLLLDYPDKWALINDTYAPIWGQATPGLKELLMMVMESENVLVGDPIGHQLMLHPAGELLAGLFMAE